MLKTTVVSGIILLTFSFTALGLTPNEKEGEKLFKKNCVQCHGLTGEANTKIAKMLSTPPANFDDPNYKDSRGKKLAAYSDEELGNKIKYGSKGTAMPSFKSTLSDEQIKYLVDYVRSFRSK